MKTCPTGAVANFAVNKCRGEVVCGTEDCVAVEEPLEIRLRGTTPEGAPFRRVIAITMRTPGHDEELAAGFLFGEGLLQEPGQVAGIDAEASWVEVELRRDVHVDLTALERHSFVSSSCGVCGKKCIAAVHVQQRLTIDPASPVVCPTWLHRLPESLRTLQPTFDATGGIHASALFEAGGACLAVREDVGRHNALDKVIGAQFLQGALPLAQHVLWVSGRASFELVQKAAMAGIAMMVAVGAPSSLAVQLACDRGMTLLGFARNQRFNLYAGAQRVALSGRERSVNRDADDSSCVPSARRASPSRTHP